MTELLDAESSPEECVADFAVPLLEDGRAEDLFQVLHRSRVRLLDESVDAVEAARHAENKEPHLERAERGLDLREILDRYETAFVLHLHERVPNAALIHPNSDLVH